MNAELDYNLTPDQWETLKALRAPVSKLSTLNRLIIRDLVALHLVAMIENVAVITPQGRKVLIRGSSRLLDVAA
jgi:hypothetical protein